jgi:hypothetical protein
MQQILRKVPAHLIDTVPYWGVVLLLVYLPFHVFLSQSLSVVTGGLELWKVGKDVILALLVMFTICLVFLRRRAGRAFIGLLAFTVVYGLLHILEWWLHPDIYGRSAIIGTIYNMRVPGFALLGLGAAILTPHKFAFSSLMRILIGVSSLVVFLGILQYLLPKDILSHVGYSIPRGVRPAFFIDDNPAFPRIMATLRDPNSLGAYLLVPIAVLTHAVLRMVGRHRIGVAVLLGAHLLAVYLTFSRGAWLATAFVVAGMVWWRYRHRSREILRRGWPIMVVFVFGFCIGLFAIRNTSFYQGVIIHATSQDSPTDLNSNGYHLAFARQGLLGITDDPLGHGPGTAGLASIQNPAGSFLTENYYLQIGYEVGVLGLLLFIGLNIWVYYRIGRSPPEWRSLLLMTFWAYVLINMLLHMWSNEAVTGQWWLLAGVAVAMSAQLSHQKASTETKRPA